MAHKKNGQLTSWSEWHKHLRKVGKRFFWKKERIEEKKYVRKEHEDAKNDEKR